MEWSRRSCPWRTFLYSDSQFEVCAHKFVNFDGEDYGLALLNNGKYGHRAGIVKVDVEGSFNVLTKAFVSSYDNAFFVLGYSELRFQAITKSSRHFVRELLTTPYRKINWNLSYIGFRFLLSRSTIHAILFSRPVSVLASKYAFTYVFFIKSIFLCAERTASGRRKTRLW